MARAPRATGPTVHACDDMARDNLKLVQVGGMLIHALPFCARGAYKGPTQIAYCPWCGCGLKYQLATEKRRKPPSRKAKATR